MDKPIETLRLAMNAAELAEATFCRRGGKEAYDAMMKARDARFAAEAALREVSLTDQPEK